MSSLVVTTLLLASYARCVVINEVNCEARSTLDISKDPDWIVPKPPLPGVPAVARPPAAAGR